MRVALLLVTMFVAACTAVHKAKNPADIFTLCNRNNPELSSCVKGAIETIRPRLMKGIPEVNLPPLEPLFIQTLENTEGTGKNAFRQVLRNVSIHGLGVFQVKECRVPADLSRFYLDMFTPVVSFDAEYEISGRILSLPITGNGTCKFIFNNVRTAADMPVTRVQRDGKEFLRAQSFKWIIEADSGSVHFDNLFNGDPKLGETMNKFLNENWKDVFEAYKHLPEEALGYLFTDFTNRVYDEYPADVLFPV